MISISCDTVPNLIQRAGYKDLAPGLVWIDVQGHEPSVLLGIDDHIDCPILVEYTPEYWGTKGLSIVISYMQRRSALWVDVGAMADREFLLTLRQRTAPVFRKPEDLRMLAVSGEQLHTDILILPKCDERGDASGHPIP